MTGLVGTILSWGADLQSFCRRMWKTVEEKMASRKNRNIKLCQWAADLTLRVLCLCDSMLEEMKEMGSNSVDKVEALKVTCWMAVRSAALGPCWCWASGIQLELHVVLESSILHLGLWAGFSWLSCYSQGNVLKSVPSFFRIWRQVNFPNLVVWMTVIWETFS